MISGAELSVREGDMLAVQKLPGIRTVVGNRFPHQHRALHAKSTFRHGTEYAVAGVAMSAAVPPPKETRHRLCPHCLSLAVAPTGHVTIDGTGIRSAYRCDDCAKDFVLLAAGWPSGWARAARTARRLRFGLSNSRSHRGAVLVCVGYRQCRPEAVC